jgi:hypothetical protein
MTLIKYTLLILFSMILTFSSSIPASAQSFNPCAPVSQDPNPNEGFSNLCTLDFSNPGGTIYTVVVSLLIIASLLALFYLIWGGFKWIISGGDKAKVQNARDTIVGAIVGLIITFLSFYILSFVLQLFNIQFDDFTIPQLNLYLPQ